MIGKILSLLVDDGPIGKVIDRVVPDVNGRREAKDELKKIIIDTEAQAQLLQIEVNREEAKHPSMFVAGARPGAMWICNAGLAYNFVLYPLITYATAIWAPDVQPPPTMNITELMALLAGTLGLSGWRSFDHMNGTSKDSLGIGKFL